MSDDTRPRATPGGRGVPRAGARAPVPGAGRPIEGRPERPEFVPAPKKGAPVVVTVGVLAALVVTGGLFGYGYFRKKRIEAEGPVVVTTPESESLQEWRQILGKIGEAERKYRATMAMRTGDDVEAFQTQVEETMDFIGGILDEVDLFLEPVRDPVTGDVPVEYNKYNHDAQQLVVWLKDLSSVSTFGIGN